MKPLHRALAFRAQAVACFVLGVLSVHSTGAHAQAQATPPADSAASAASAKPAEATPAFAVYEYAVEGNTVLPVAAVEKAVTPFLGEGKTFADVDGARAALEKTYQDAGYLSVFVDLPEQAVGDGVIRLVVLEGRIERLAVTGSRYYSQGYIRQQVPELAEGKVPNFNVVQAQLAVVNRTEDRRVQPVLRPGHDNGTVEAELQVTDKLPVHGTVELNNNHAQYTKPWRLQASARYDNLFQGDHSLSMTAIVAPQDVNESKVLMLDYSMPEPDGDAWRMSALFSDSSIQALSAATVIGKGFELGLHRQWALPASGNWLHNLTASVAYKDTKERTLVGSDQLATPIRYVPFGLDYGGSFAHEDGGLSTLSASMTYGFRQLLRRRQDCADLGENDQFACKRNNADGGFAYLRLDGRHTQPLGRWQVDYRLAVQMSSQPLIGAEQFAIGGPGSVRGYLSAEALGDHGVVSSLEVRTPNLVTPGWWNIEELRTYAFVDAGLVRTIYAAQGQAARQGLGSVGVGLKLRATKALNLTLDLADPFKTGTATGIHDPRLHMALSLDF